MKQSFASGMISEDALRSIPLRATATKSWDPIRHADALDLVLGGMDRAGLKIADKPGSKQFTVINDGHRVFGQFILEAKINPEIALMLGFANSTDKSTALKVGFGSSVFVCSNGCFFAERVVGRKHTSRIMVDIDQKIDEALASAEDLIRKQNLFFERLGQVELSDEDANDLVVRSCRDRGIISKGQVIDVIDEFHDPSFDEFKDPNAWSMHNAFTEVLKKTQRTNGIGHSDRTIALTDFLRDEFAADLALLN